MPPHGSSTPREEDLAAVMRTVADAEPRPHGRTHRFEESFDVDTLPALDADARLRIGALLGEGGMGRVHSATQVLLDREVAVKTLRDPLTARRSLERFLQEARVTGLVEHPNVVPVYDLVVGDDALPALVMKRIEGVSWLQVLREPERVPEEERSDPVLWHLRVLMQLCDAVQYAHENGILHRDIKPENVMIGSFGEVYLLDWGLAISMNEEHAGFIALARDARGFVGTPAYIAPEMAVGDPKALGPTVDVYLLGATLHEVLTGAPPHTGETLYAVIRQAWESGAREYPPDVPSDLAEICRKAMAREPKDRYPSVGELREALESFLVHRESRALTEAGTERLSELERRIDTTPEAEAAINDLFGAVRFSLGQALRLWPENQSARDAWQRALGKMARYELERGREASAAALIAELAEPEAQLTGKLKEIRAERERREHEVRELRQLQREHDPRVALRTRSFVALVLAVVWPATAITFGRLRAAGVVDFDPTDFVWGAVANVVILGAITLRFRGLTANAVNRQIMVSVFGCIIATVLGRIAAAVYAQDVGVTYAREQLVYALAGVAIAILSDWRIVITAVCFTCTAIASAQLPHLALELGGAGAFVSMLILWAAWRQQQ